MPALSDMDLSILSDLHKDARGFRPRGEAFWAGVKAMSIAEYDAYFAGLQDELEESEKREREMQADAVERFEAVIRDTIAAGARDRATAIQWLRDAEDDDMARVELDYFEFLHGLPYGYLKEEA